MRTMLSRLATIMVCVVLQMEQIMDHYTPALDLVWWYNGMSLYQIRTMMMSLYWACFGSEFKNMSMVGGANCVSACWSLGRLRVTLLTISPCDTEQTCHQLCLRLRHNWWKLNITTGNFQQLTTPTKYTLISLKFSLHILRCTIYKRAYAF